MSNLNDLILKCERIDSLPADERYHHKAYIYAAIIASRVHKQSPNAELEITNLYKSYAHLIPKSFETTKIIAMALHIYSSKPPGFRNSLDNRVPEKEKKSIETPILEAVTISVITLENSAEVYQRLHNKALDPSSIGYLFLQIGRYLNENINFSLSENIKNLIYLAFRHLKLLEEYINNPSINTYQNTIAIIIESIWILNKNTTLKLPVSETSLDKLVNKFFSSRLPPISISKKDHPVRNIISILHGLSKLNYKNKEHFQLLFKLLIPHLSLITPRNAPPVLQTLVYCEYILHEPVNSLLSFAQRKQIEKLFESCSVRRGKEDDKLHEALKRKVFSLPWETPIFAEEHRIHGFCLDSYIQFTDKNGGHLKIGIEYDKHFHYQNATLRPGDVWRDQLLEKTGIKVVRIFHEGVLSPSKAARIIAKEFLHIVTIINNYVIQNKVDLFPKVVVSKPTVDTAREKKLAEQKKQAEINKQKREDFQKRIAEKKAEEDEKNRQKERKKIDEKKKLHDALSDIDHLPLIEKLKEYEARIIAFKARITNHQIQKRSRKGMPEFKSDQEFTKFQKFVEDLEEDIKRLRLQAATQITVPKFARTNLVRLLTAAAGVAKSAELPEAAATPPTLLALEAPKQLPRIVALEEKRSTQIASLIDFIRKNELTKIREILKTLAKNIKIADIEYDRKKLLYFPNSPEVLTCLTNEFELDINSPVDDTERCALYFYIDSSHISLIKYCLNITNLNLQASYMGLNYISYLLYSAIPQTELFSIIEPMATLYEDKEEDFFIGYLKFIKFLPHNQKFEENIKEMLKHNTRAIHEIDENESNVFHLICDLNDAKWHIPLIDLVFQYNKAAVAQHNANRQTPADYASSLKKDSLAKHLRSLEKIYTKKYKKLASAAAAHSATAPAAPKKSNKPEILLPKSALPATPAKEEKSWMAELPSMMESIQQRLNQMALKLQEEKCNEEAIIDQLIKDEETMDLIRENEELFNLPLSSRMFTPLNLTMKWNLLQSKMNYCWALVYLKKPETLKAQSHLIKALAHYPAFGIAAKLVESFKTASDVKAFVKYFPAEKIGNIAKHCASYFQKSPNLIHLMELFFNELIIEATSLFKIDQPLKAIELFKILLLLKENFSFDLSNQKKTLYELAKSSLKSAPAHSFTQKELIRSLHLVISFGAKNKSELKELLNFLHLATTPGRPLYVDPKAGLASESFNLEMESLKKELTKKTFGPSPGLIPDNFGYRPKR